VNDSGRALNKDGRRGAQKSIGQRGRVVAMVAMASMEISIWLAEQHPRLVAFPIVLLLSALGLDCVGLIGRNERAHWAARLAWLAGTASLLGAFVCGICAEIWAGRAGVPHQQIKIHELAATVAAWGFIALTAWRLFLNVAQRRTMTVFLACGVALYAMIARTGYLGGKLVTDYGAAVAGAEAKTVTSLHDLNTLAQRQTDANLEYSDFMHHMAGWFVLALTVSIFVRELWPHHAGKVRWVGPTLLKVGGVLLFIFADMDLYALSDVRQFYDREVQAHKLIALIMTGLGIYLLVRRREPQAAGPYQNRIIAVFALVGGGLLFTHVHTVAPYANVAAGVYINHVAMGLVALAIGAVKLFWPRRTLLFPALLGLESLLLITYTEGLPWYIGIGHYNRWGANGGAIAPFGRMRAELVFDDGRLDVRFFERFEDKPLRIGATNIVVTIARGYQKTVVPLAGDGSRFSGRAEFLKDATFFDASVTLPDGRTAWFDPWVTPAVAGIPPNELARYVCPMHEGVRATEAGDCRLCGMPLVPLDNRPRTSLHDDKYGLKFEHRDGRLIFTPQNMGKLAIVHEHPLHLIITDENLDYFDHIHPEPQSDGTLAIPYRFPDNRRYLLFAELTPAGDRAQAFRFEFPVGRDRRARRGQPGGLALPTSREIGAYHVELLTQPRRLVAQREAQLVFRLERDGKPVTDLQPYIGALGHCVVISEDTQRYLHSHPEQLTPPVTGGPMVSFHTEFPAPGRYKVWGQFKHRDEIIVADFVVEVGRPLLPRGLVKTLLND
jgi:uncharacterized membrane protein